MTNIVRGEHTIQHEGQDIRLVLDMDAFTEACAVLDVGINGLMSALEGDDPKPHVIRALVYGALKRYNPIPLNDIMTFVSSYGITKMANELQALAMATMPVATADTVGNVKQQTQKPSRPKSAKPKTRSGGSGRR